MTSLYDCGQTLTGRVFSEPAKPSVWECEDIYPYYTRAPFTLPLNTLGPVKVFARWAYAWDGLSWVPMVKD